MQALSVSIMLGSLSNSRTESTRRRRRPSTGPSPRKPTQLDLGFAARYQRRDFRKVAELAGEVVFLLEQALRGPPPDGDSCRAESNGVVWGVVCPEGWWLVRSPRMMILSCPRGFRTIRESWRVQFSCWALELSLQRARSASRGRNELVNLVGRWPSAAIAGLMRCCWASGQVRWPSVQVGISDRNTKLRSGFVVSDCFGKWGGARAALSSGYPCQNVPRRLSDGTTRS